MKTFSRLGLSIFMLLQPVLAIAAPPQSVSGITAQMENGNVRVAWNQVVNTDIASYRIFYSHSSILQNGGLYDDFESVDGTVNTHLLQNFPRVNELYVALLAVNTRGEESPYFVEEAKVAIGSTQQATSSAPSAPAMPPDGQFRLMSVDVESATGVVLRFSHPVSIPQAQATQAITIETASGTKLTMRRFVIQNNNVTIHTTPQTRGVVYKVTISPLITARDTAGKLLNLASDQQAVLFTGHPLGRMSDQAGQQTPQPSSGPKAEVIQLRIHAQPDGANTYSVETTWQAPAGNPVGYQVAQTTDGGKTYGAPQTIGADRTGVKVRGIPPGSFGIMVRAIYTDGMSNGISQMISLPRAGSTGGNQGSVTPPTTQVPGTLPHSGPALWLVTMGASAAIGAWKMRQKKATA